MDAHGWQCLAVDGGVHSRCSAAATHTFLVVLNCAPRQRSAVRRLHCPRERDSPVSTSWLSGAPRRAITRRSIFSAKLSLLCLLYHAAQVNADLTKEFTYVEVSGEYNEALGKLCAAHGHRSSQCSAHRKLRERRCCYSLGLTAA